MLPGMLVHDLSSAALTSGVALGLLRFWGETAKRRVFEQKTNRKLVHISFGLVFMLFWPLFSPGHLAPLLAALAPGVNIIRMLLLGLGIWKDEATVESMSREGDYRYMHYFASFGFIEESWSMILSFLLVAAAAAVVESLPVSSELDDNLTVPLTSLLVGAVVF